MAQEVMAVKMVDTVYGRQLAFDTDIYLWPILKTVGEYSAGEVQLFRQIVQEGDIVIDAGANIGCHSLALGRLVGASGAVLSFEPQRRLFYMLSGSVALNELWQVHPYNVALGAENGQTLVGTFEYTEPGLFCGGQVGLPEGYGYPVELRTIDSFDLPRLKLLKADVEGYEMQLLDGARKTIDRCRPLLYIENEHGDRGGVIDKIRSMGYDIYLHETFMEPPRNPFADEVWYESIMLFAVPEECGMTVEYMKTVRGAEDMPASNYHHLDPTILERV